ncbi:hypothetical protein [Pseudoalteromonas umbrosa]|uniref:hypothetical protein n=1 Tax=Pseudoalteromonas umbrosa TaxID=3048489 RepID=UPI0024C2663F|nr:hypothetical protein [Pseudoalteromonas sp. B95]MDK1289798.1 hypothetical protein [Pseudoalteromonas sp. B95]
MKTIKEVRKALKQWGRYWASKEQLQGYSSKSNAEKIRENHLLGGLFKSDGHLYSHGSSNINPPEHIKELSAQIDKLRTEHKQVLVGKYVKGMGNTEISNWATTLGDGYSVDFWLLRAEKSLMS